MNKAWSLVKHMDFFKKVVDIYIVLCYSIIRKREETKGQLKLDSCHCKRREPLQLNTDRKVRDTRQRAVTVSHETLARRVYAVVTLYMLNGKAPAVNNPSIPPDKMHDTGKGK
nr:MAG TPA: hypothetical protein [Caudoviricetes sp.]